MKMINEKKLVMHSLYIALFLVLSIYGTINFGNMKITLQNIPIIISAFHFGPVSAVVVAGIGMLLNQILAHGIMFTTPIWILPHMIFGFYVGVALKLKWFDLKNSFHIGILIVTGLLILTMLNTLSLYIDSKIMGYYTFQYVFGTFIIRIVSALVSGIVYAILLPPLIKYIKNEL